MYVLAPYMYVYTLLLFCKEKHTYNFYAVFVIVMCRVKPKAWKEIKIVCSHRHDIQIRIIQVQFDLVLWILF